MSFVSVEKAEDNVEYWEQVIRARQEIKHKLDEIAVDARVQHHDRTIFKARTEAQERCEHAETELITARSVLKRVKAADAARSAIKSGESP